MDKHTQTERFIFQLTKQLSLIFVIGSTAQHCPSVVYNPHFKNYIILYHVKATSVHSNKFVIVTRRVSSGSWNNITKPTLSIRGTTPAGVAADIVTTTIIYNPITYGYVVASQMKLPNRIQIISAYLTGEGYLKSGGPVFSFSVNVLQPRAVFDELTKMFVFVSQLDKSHPQLSTKNVLLQNSLPASGYPNSPPQAVVIGSTTVDNSSISLHFDNATRCVRVCFLHVNDNALTDTTCSKLCASGFNRYNVRPLDVSFCTCKNTAINPHVIEYPVNSAVFGVWEEKDSTRHRLHGYFVSTVHFQQNPPATVQEHPRAVYKSSDGQVCVAWRYQSFVNTCSKLGIRCFESTTRCNDKCCCQQRNNPHCGKQLYLSNFNNISNNNNIAIIILSIVGISN